MRHFILLLAINLCSTNTSFSQIDSPFPNDPSLEATWVQRRYIPADPADPWQTVTEYIYSYNNFGIDTIEGIEYNRLYQDWNGPIAHYRIDGSKVYYRSDNAAFYSYDEHGLSTWQGGGEYLMYDFDLSVGDTFEVITYGDIIVTSIDSILIDSIYCKTIHFDENQIPWYQPLEYYWIEGIGSSTGFYPVFDYFEDQLNFHCFWDSHLTYFTNGYGCFDSADIEEAPDLNQYTIYPNPTSKIITIKTDKPNPCFGKITNLQGQTVLNFELSQTETTLNIADLEQGIYFINLMNHSFHMIKE